MLPKRIVDLYRQVVSPHQFLDTTIIPLLRVHVMRQQQRNTYGLHFRGQLEELQHTKNALLSSIPQNVANRLRARQEWSAFKQLATPRRRRLRT